ncbi:MAG: hypothetical protein V4679_03295 [Pseudomonadota bacterium]
MNRFSLRTFALLTVSAMLPLAAGAKPPVPPPEYPRLSENTAASQHLEVRKVLHGQVEGLFALPRTRQLVAVAGGYLWKFSPQGQVQDTLRVPSGIHTSGVVFTPHYYMDWVYSGDRRRKAYAPAVDGNRLSKAELFAELDRAEHVEFGRNETSAWAYLLANGKAWILDITRQRDKVDTYCRQRTHSAEKLGWDATCLEGYQAARKGWAEIEPGDFDSTGQDRSRVKVVDFDRRRLHLEEGLSGQLLGATVGVALKALGVPGNLPSRYWFGDAYIQLQVGGEVVRFKTFIPKEDGQYRFPHMAWWDPSPVLPDAGPWFTVHPRSYLHHPGEEALLRHYEKDIGLYVVRPRGSVPGPVTGREAGAWRPVFTGPSTHSYAVSGMVEFAPARPGEAAGLAAHTWLRSPDARKRHDGMGPQIPVQALWPALQALPSALTLQWNASSEEEDRQLRIELPAGEIRAAFERLQGGKGPLELVVQVPDLEGPTSGMSVLLRSGSLQQVLSGAHMAYVGNPARPASTRKISVQALREANAAAQRSPGALPAFLQVAQDLAQDLQSVQGNASDITHAYAQLINHFNGRQDFASSSRLVRHYLAQVYPSMGKYQRDDKQVYNVGVIASQTLAFAMRTNERDLAEAVMASLVGPGFDPAVQTNGTLMYNLACYYALTSDKARLLQAAARARSLGKPPSQFLQDTDFERYLQDPEFLQVVNAPS